MLHTGTEHSVFFRFTLFFDWVSTVCAWLGTQRTSCLSRGHIACALYFLVCAYCQLSSALRLLCAQCCTVLLCAHLAHPIFWGGFIVDWFLSIAPVGGISHYLFTLYSFYPEAFCLNLQFLSDLFPLGDLESWQISVVLSVLFLGHLCFAYEGYFVTRQTVLLLPMWTHGVTVFFCYPLKALRAGYCRR